MSKFTTNQAFELLSAPVNPLERVRFLLNELSHAVYDAMSAVDEGSELYLALGQFEETAEFGNGTLDKAIQADKDAELAREQAELDEEDAETDYQAELRHQRIESYAIHGVGYR